MAPGTAVPPPVLLVPPLAPVVPPVLVVFPPVPPLAAVVPALREVPPVAPVVVLPATSPPELLLVWVVPPFGGDEPAVPAVLAPPLLRADDDAPPLEDELPPELPAVALLADEFPPLEVVLLLLTGTVPPLFVVPDDDEPEQAIEARARQTAETARVEIFIGGLRRCRRKRHRSSAQESAGVFQAQAGLRRIATDEKVCPSVAVLSELAPTRSNPSAVPGASTIHLRINHRRS